MTCGTLHSSSATRPFRGLGRGATADQCELHAVDGSTGVLGRAETAEPCRAERTHTYGLIGQGELWRGLCGRALRPATQVRAASIPLSNCCVDGLAASYLPLEASAQETGLLRGDEGQRRPIQSATAACHSGNQPIVNDVDGRHGDAGGICLRQCEADILKGEGAKERALAGAATP
jgi:hypothetical protein